MSKITWGQHKGTEINELPQSYLEWLLNPVLKNGKTFNVSKEIQDEARAVLEFKPEPQDINFGETSNPKLKALELVTALRDTLVDLEDMIKGM